MPPSGVQFNASPILQHINGIVRRCENLAALQEPIRRVVIEGNRTRALAGTDALGQKFAPLAPRTRKRRRGSGPPLAPQGASSRVVSGFVANVQTAPGRLTVTGSWPNLSWMQYHATGTARMPRRDPEGFTESTLTKIRELLETHVLNQINGR